jgi:group I intron endonuclease
MQSSGIYKIQSSIHPEKIYIGSAVNIDNRRYEHLKKLRRNKHHSIKLQNHYNKYGEYDLIFSTIFECPKENLLIHEQSYIDALDPYFNICKVAGNTLGVKGAWSEETIKRFSEYRKANSKGEKNGFYHKHHSEENKLKMKLAWTEERREKARKHQFINRGKNAARLKGENNPNAKLNQLQIDEILLKCKTGNYKYRELAVEYNVCSDTIYRLNRVYNRKLPY